MRRTSPRVSAFALAGLLVLAGAASSPPPAGAAWLPLAVGNEWTYFDDGDEPHTEAIVDVAHVRGRRAYVKQYTGGLDDGLLNVYQEGPDGSVLLLGYYKPWYPFGLVYEPPVRVFPGQPQVGYEWSTHTVAYAIPDNVVYGEFDTYWRVRAEYTFTVMAGTFHCFGVGQVAPPAVRLGATSLGLDGRVLGGAGVAPATGPDSADEWYSDGTGIVISSIHGLDGVITYQLASADGPTPARPSTWGRLKALYH